MATNVDKIFGTRFTEKDNLTMHFVNNENVKTVKNTSLIKNSFDSAFASINPYLQTDNSYRNDEESKIKGVSNYINKKRK